MTGSFVFVEGILRDLSEISRGEGVETEGGSQLFETAEKGGVMKNGPLKGGGSCKCVRDHVEVHPQKKKEVLYLKKNVGEIGESSDQLPESESDS